MSESFQLIQDRQGKLTLRRPGQADVADVRIRRVFPWSIQRRYISLRSSEGRELILIEDLDQLDAGQRQLIMEWLAGQSFVPRITSVQSVELLFSYQQWTVETDRGPAEFSVREREDIRFLPDGRFSIRDADGTVYELPRLDQLDEASRRAVHALI